MNVRTVHGLNGRKQLIRWGFGYVPQLFANTRKTSHTYFELHHDVIEFGAP